jgi:hypothetical protein
MPRILVTDHEQLVAWFDNLCPFMGPLRGALGLSGLQWAITG